MPIDPISLLALADLIGKASKAIASAARGEEPTNEDLTIARIASDAAHDDLDAEIEKAKARNGV